MSNIIHNGEDRFNEEWLKNVTEKQAIKSLRANYEVNTIIKVWKIANGKSIPDYLKDSEEEKPKRTRKKKEATEDVEEKEAQD
jgi:hypothetical protein